MLDMDHPCALELQYSPLKAGLISDRIALPDFVPWGCGSTLTPVPTMQELAHPLFVLLQQRNLVPFTEDAPKLPQMPLNHVQRALKCLLAYLSFNGIEEMKDRSDTAGNLQHLGS